MPRRKQVEETKTSKKEKVKLNKVKLDKKKISILVGILLLFILVICLKNYKELGLVINRKITDESVNTVELASKNNSIFSYKNEVLVYSMGNLATYDRYGKNTWTESLSTVADATVNVSGNYIQVVNKDKGIIYVYKNKYETARIKIEGTIKSAEINENGYTVVEYTITGAKTVLSVYDKSGKVKYNVKLGQEVIGKYALSNDARYLAYVDINLSGISVSLSVDVIDLKNSSEDNFKTYEVFSKDNELVYDMSIDSNTLICRTDNSIVKYKLSNQKLEEYKITENNLVYIDLYKNKYSVIKTIEDGTYVFGIDTLTKNDENAIKLEEVPKYFERVNNITYIAYQKKIEIYNDFKVKIKEYDSDMVITKPVVFNNGSSVAMLLSNKLLIFTI